MKKLIGIVTLVLIMAAMLTACGKFKCNLCFEEKFGKQHEVTILGQDLVYCDDCYENLDNLTSIFK